MSVKLDISYFDLWVNTRGLTSEAVICHEITHAERFRYCEKHSRIAKELLDQVDKCREATKMYKYIVVCRCGIDNVYFPSNSQNALKHISENNAKYCWVYDKDGWLVSRAEIITKTGKAVKLPLNLDGEPRMQFVDMLNKFNALIGLSADAAPVTSGFTSGAISSLDEKIAQAREGRRSGPGHFPKQPELHER